MTHLHVYNLQGDVIWSTPLKASDQMRGDLLQHAHYILTTYLQMPVEVHDFPLQLPSGNYGVFYMGPLPGFFVLTDLDDAPNISNELARSILSHKQVSA